MDRFVHFEIVDRIAVITLDSQHNRNALSRQLLAELGDALDQAEDGDASAIVVRHEGPVFCSGADLKERSDGSGPPDSSPFVRVLERLMDTPQPTIAAVTGVAKAGGLGLMAACDLVVIASAATFTFSEIRIGVAPAIISVPILRRVPPGKIATAMLTGESFTAAQALDFGLVTHVSSDVPDTVRSLCDGIRAGAPRAVAATKRLLHRVPTLQRDQAFDEMRALSDELFQGPDAIEGMTAFRERRVPVWPGPQASSR